ncbi:rRNA maturation RNase YbeY [Shimia sp.]|uniref:rRNA maturation RNase YbeY n=1 Tax=Shimia sp. TaxID=1954381 RepID=UPI003297FC98
MTIDIVFEDDRWVSLELEVLAARASGVALTHFALDPDGFEIALLACDDTRIADLNSDFRGKPAPTNVLSWPSEERGASEPGAVPDLPGPDFPDMPVELGDIAIAWETCQREAEAASKPMSDHVTHLLVHGVLHLMGYDHVRDKDATLMEQLEVVILGKMGIANPYT